MTLSTLANGYILGWSVAWPPGPINAEMIGALTWGVVLCTALKFGAHIFSHPNWQVATEAITAAVMLWFAIRLLLHFHEPDYRTTDRNPDDQRDLSLDSG